jgi:hypothetical protein
MPSRIRRLMCLRAGGNGVLLVRGGKRELGGRQIFRRGNQARIDRVQIELFDRRLIGWRRERIRFRGGNGSEESGRCRPDFFARDISLFTRRHHFDFAVAERRANQFHNGIFRKHLVGTNARSRSMPEERRCFDRNDEEFAVTFCRACRRDCRLCRVRAPADKDRQDGGGREESRVIHSASLSTWRATLLVRIDQANRGWFAFH